MFEANMMMKCYINRGWVACEEDEGELCVAEDEGIMAGLTEAKLGIYVGMGNGS